MTNLQKLAKLAVDCMEEHEDGPCAVCPVTNCSNDGKECYDKLIDWFMKD